MINTYPLLVNVGQACLCRTCSSQLPQLAQQKPCLPPPFTAFRKDIKVAWGDLQSKASWPDLYSALRISQVSTKETPYIAVELPERHRSSTALKWQNYLEDESDFFLQNEEFLPKRVDFYGAFHFQEFSLERTRS